MKNLFIKFWVGLTILMPALIGLYIMTNPEGAMAATGLTTHDLAFGVGSRNIIYSLMILGVALYYSRNVVGLLIIGRGLTEVADTLGTLLAGGALGFNTIMPLVSAMVSFAVGYYLMKSDSSKKLFG